MDGTNSTFMAFEAFSDYSNEKSQICLSEYMYVYKIIPQNLDIAFSGLYLRHRKYNAKRDKYGHLRTFADK